MEDINILQTFLYVCYADSGALTGAIDYTGDTYNGIGDMFEKQVCKILVYIL